jgi:uncharacterized Zn-binding protein involved in type VI secretion|tara:strand:+ start:299 stop:580 length:282 start_codon:yes stop_codon:yes gene_type:complete
VGKPAQRNGDANNAGGVINSIPQSNVFCNSQLLAVDGSKGTGHPLGPPHAAGVWTTGNGSSTVKCNGIPVNRQGDSDSCAHVRVGGSNNVNIG